MAQLANDLDAVAIVEVVIDQEGVGFCRMLRNDCQRGFGILRLQDRATPAAQ